MMELVVYSNGHIIDTIWIDKQGLIVICITGKERQEEVKRKLSFLDLIIFYLLQRSNLMGIEWKDIEYFTDEFNSRTRTLIDLLVDSEL